MVFNLTPPLLSWALSHCGLNASTSFFYLTHIFRNSFLYSLPHRAETSSSHFNHGLLDVHGWRFRKSLESLGLALKLGCQLLTPY